MGVDVTLGLEFEDEDLLAEELEAVNTALTSHGLPPHAEPEEWAPVKSRATLKGFPYSVLHELRRAAVYALEQGKLPEFDPHEDPSDDPLVVENVLEGMLHLVCHSDREGYYVPTDFEEPIVEEGVPGEILGSSQQLLSELVAVAPYLGITLDGDSLSDAEASRVGTTKGKWTNERIAWLALYEAARLSVERHTVIRFG
jgi:hypothetical protein